MALSQEMTHLMVHEVAPVVADLTVPVLDRRPPPVGVEGNDRPVLAADAAVGLERQTQRVDVATFSEDNAKRTAVVGDEAETGPGPTVRVVEHRQRLCCQIGPGHIVNP